MGQQKGLVANFPTTLYVKKWPALAHLQHTVYMECTLNFTLSIIGLWITPPQCSSAIHDYQPIHFKLVGYDSIQYTFNCTKVNKSKLMIAKIIQMNSNEINPSDYQLKSVNNDGKSYRLSVKPWQEGKSHKAQKSYDTNTNRVQPMISQGRMPRILATSLMLGSTILFLSTCFAVKQNRQGYIGIKSTVSTYFSHIQIEKFNNCFEATTLRNEIACVWD